MSETGREGACVFLESSCIVPVLRRSDTRSTKRRIIELVGGLQSGLQSERERVEHRTVISRHEVLPIYFGGWYGMVWYSMV